ncbi:MAG TPA: thymidylate kinase [Terriglobales bacterium]
MADLSYQKPLLITFSGVDGSGKSTQIAGLQSALHAAGLRTRRLAFWDDVVVGAKSREGFVHKVYKSESGIGAPGKPVKRRDKNMRGWHLTWSRHVLYLMDAIRLSYVVAAEQMKVGVDVVIFDRYIYDELANLNLVNRFTRWFVTRLIRLAPQPDLAFLLDADPAAAYARKPEYPVDFMQKCRVSYHDLARLQGTLRVIPALELPQAKLAVLRIAEQSLAERGRFVNLVPDNLSLA